MSAGNVDEDNLSLREAQKQLTLEKLRRAARTVFHQKGYSAATIEDIVEEAGASRGTFYLYFRSKGDVLTTIFHEEHIGAVLGLVEKFPLEPTVASIRTWVEQYLRLYASDRLTIRAWVQAGSREADLRNSSLAEMDHVLDRLAEHVVRLRRGRKLPGSAEEARVRALLMFMQMQDFAYYEYIRGYPINEKIGVQLLAEQWYAALYGTDPERELDG